MITGLGTPNKTSYHLRTIVLMDVEHMDEIGRGPWLRFVIVYVETNRESNVGTLLWQGTTEAVLRYLEATHELVLLDDIDQDMLRRAVNDGKSR